ncbi:transcriptional regulator [Salmonella enterica]|nr:transcriptional regulator [Salmonella enterica]ECE0791409.1 transcriptional regulator [Salmonella enterica subsp. diarizonae]EGY8941940.1 transcriptional regulator [Salmonella enterica subsp. diarizonae serovar 60:r:z]HCS9547678.1 winged helix-turn-helix domain-containing protein [Salmonella enterica subsp. diarizonae serovar 61:r:z53]EAQ1549422.1 transcriptional regulator [Salmonella enterica]
MHWIINRYIVFLPDNKKLVSLNNQDVEVVLTAPACRCLLLLLESHPDIVTQRQFYKTVWEDDGIIVPANTLYQNISIVRRGLRNVGQTEAPVVNTIPRKGFQIDKDVEITCVDSEFRIIDASQSTSDVTHPDIENETDLSSTAKCLVVKTQPEKQEKYNFLTSYDVRTICFILLAFWVGAAGGYYLWNADSTKNFYADYKLVDKDKGYNFFIKDETHNEQSEFKHFKRLLLSSGVSYKKYPWIYFPLSTISPGLSMLACSKKYTNTSPMQCVTLSFRETNNE